MIAAEGEQKASWALREASEVIAESSSALQLRYLQVRFFVSIQKNHLAQELMMRQIVCMEIVKNNPQIKQTPFMGRGVSLSSALPFWATILYAFEIVFK